MIRWQVGSFGVDDGFERAARHVLGDETHLIGLGDRDSEQRQDVVVLERRGDLDLETNLLQFLGARKDPVRKVQLLGGHEHGRRVARADPASAKDRASASGSNVLLHVQLGPRDMANARIVEDAFERQVLVLGAETGPVVDLGQLLVRVVAIDAHHRDADGARGHDEHHDDRGGEHQPAPPREDERRRNERHLDHGRVAHNLLVVDRDVQQIGAR